MLHIITEDSKVGYDFWKFVFEIFLDNSKYKMHASAGNRMLQKCFNEVLEDCENSKDSILLIFDNIDDTSNFNPGNLIEHCEAVSSEKGVEFYHSDFYCFESVFLSYREIVNMTKDCDPHIKETIQYVNASINNRIGYWDSTDDIIDKFLDKCEIEAKNREHFESELLSIATRRIRYGCFHIKKSKLDRGKCWIRSCDDVQATMNSYVYDKDCVTLCDYKNKDMDSRLKVNDIFNNTILNNSSIVHLIKNMAEGN